MSCFPFLYSNKVAPSDVANHAPHEGAPSTETPSAASAPLPLWEQLRLWFAENPINNKQSTDPRMDDLVKAAQQCFGEISNYELYRADWKVAVSFFKAGSNDVFPADFNAHELQGRRLFSLQDRLEKLFPDMPAQEINKIEQEVLRKLLLFWNTRNMGFYDSFPMIPGLKPGSQGTAIVARLQELSMTAELFCKHIFGLRIVEVVSVSEREVAVKVGSHVVEGTCDMFIYPSPSKQAASDVLPMLIRTGRKCVFRCRRGSRTLYKFDLDEIFTTISLKNQQAAFRFVFHDNEAVETLTIGLHGPVIAGETLTPPEKKNIAERAKDLERLSVVEVQSMENTVKDTIMRTIIEETGVFITIGKTKFFILGVHNAYMRDIRFFALPVNDRLRYSYDRGSETFVSVLFKVFDALPTDSDLGAQDRDEIKKVTTITLRQFLDDFREGGTLGTPAFISHVKIKDDIVRHKFPFVLLLGGGEEIIQDISEEEFAAVKCEEVEISDDEIRRLKEASP